MMRVLLVIPAYNEEGNIQSAVEQVRAFHPAGYTLDYLVVDDGSTDRTAEICRERGYPCLSLVQNLGIGGAVQSGYLYARRKGYDVAVQFDGDGQHDIRCLDALLEPIFQGRAELSIGSRFLGGAGGFRSTALRRVGIRYLSGLIRLFSGARVTDPTSGFRAAAAPVIARLAEDYPQDYPEPESVLTLLRQGVAVAEVPVNMFERRAGRSSINPGQAVYYMLKVSVALLCAWMQGGRRYHAAVSAR